MKKAFQASTLVAALATASAAWATPSTTVWAPSTTYTQPYLVPHISYDTYFKGGDSYPITSGLTMGVLPFEAVQGEVGFDLFYGGGVKDPLVLNGKLTLVEDKLFALQPALSVGVANAGVTSATDFAMAYGLLGKTIAGFALAAGGYYGLNGNRWLDVDGEEDRAGVLASIATPPLKVKKPFLDSVVFLADVQTGKTAFGAAGAAAALYFTSSVSLLTGPVFFLEEDTQPGGASWMWTMQLDVDLPGVAELLKGKADK